MASFYTTEEIPEIHKAGIDHVIYDEGQHVSDVLKLLVPRSITTKQKYDEMIHLSSFPMPHDFAETGELKFDRRIKIATATFEPIMRQIGWTQSKKAKVTDYYKVIATNAREGTRSMAKGRNFQGAQLYNNSFTANGPDGVPLCSHNHPRYDGGTFSNRGNGTTDLALGYANVATSLAKARAHEDYRGILIGYEGQYDLICSETNEDLARRIVYSQGMQGTANNDINGTPGRRIKQVISTPWLGWGDSTLKGYWWLRASDQNEHKLFVLHQMSLHSDADYDMVHQCYLNAMIESYIVGYMTWYGVHGNAA